MADDIVTRLREPGFCGVAAQHDAADEIERLRAAGDALVEALRGWCDGMDAFEEDQDRVRAWQEARRG